MPVSDSVSIPFMFLPSQSTKGRMEETVARIEGTSAHGKRKSLKVLFLPPVISITLSNSPVSQKSKEDAPRGAQAFHFE